MSVHCPKTRAKPTFQLVLNIILCIDFVVVKNAHVSVFLYFCLMALLYLSLHACLYTSLSLSLSAHLSASISPSPSLSFLSISQHLCLRFSFSLRFSLSLSISLFVFILSLSPHPPSPSSAPDTHCHISHSHSILVIQLISTSLSTFLSNPSLFHSLYVILFFLYHHSSFRARYAFSYFSFSFYPCHPAHLKVSVHISFSPSLYLYSIFIIPPSPHQTRIVTSLILILSLSSRPSQRL